jgi:gluconate 5-dehydrogenase
MTHTLFDIAGKSVLITGSSQGIGYALAKGMAQAGALIILNGRDTDKLAAAASELAKSGATVHQLAFDATDHGTAKAAVDQHEAQLGPVDILVNNAGMQHRTPLEDFPAAMFEKMLATNVSSVFNVAQACAKHMIARGAGKIINIASVQTSLARPGIAPYVATKGAVGNLTKGMVTPLRRATLIPR